MAAALVRWGAQPPAVRGVETPPAEFSGARAREVLARLLGTGSPHPTGSAANDRVRDQVVAELRRLGLEPEVDARLVCGGWGRCATVENVLARIPGTDPAAKVVLLAVHYDSVAAGPGASDDGAGVAAAVEVARALLAGPRLRRDVLVLVDDGEEQGLLGAEAFVQHSPWADRVGAVVNVEARGTSGPSVLFELSAGNARLVGEVAGALARPSTNSIYYTVYQRLPNDTDLTVFKRAGWPGVNFAFIGDPLRYHTPVDDLAHQDTRSLQHHGDNALAAVRALAGGDGEWRAAGDAVFFDLLGLGVVRWPEAWTLPLALLAAVLIAAGVVRACREPGAERAGWGWGVAAVLLLLGGTFAAGWGLLALLRAAGAVPYTWVARAAPLLVAFWGSAVAVAGAVAALLGRRLAARGAWAAAWGVAAAVAVLLAALAPGVSFPFVAPALLAGAVAAAAPRLGSGWSGLAATLLQALVVFPFAWKLLDALGVPALPGIALLVAIVLLGLLPAFAQASRGARLMVTAAGLVAVVAGGVAAAVAEPFTADAPRPLSLTLYQDRDSGRSRWLAGAGEGALPEALAAAGGFAAEPAAPYPWAPTSLAWPGDATATTPLAPPQLSGLAVEARADGLRVRGRLESLRGAPWGGLYVPAARLRAATVDGVDVRYPPRAEEVRRDPAAWLGIEHVTLPPGGALVELTLAGTAPLELHVWDATPGLGREGAALAAARPAWAVPIGRGDRTVVSRTVAIAAPR